QHAFNSGLISKENIIEIGSVINGTHPGRKSEKEITMFDGTGVGLQDLAVAGRVVTEAVERGLVINVEF
ncbi:MAG: ornithine cyclodeaminase family protein, partial [Rhodobacteraceae bacterium]|nr:ornithine cyclodeaminase family protein [Paracoccaceae bacterium]